MRRKEKATQAGPADSLPVIHVEGHRLPVHARVHARARRIILRLSPDRTALRLTLPHNVPIAEGLRFVETRREWIARQLKNRPLPQPFRHGLVIPYQGEPHLIVHVPGARGTVWREGSGAAARICVAGDERFLPRRLTDWLKTQARTALLQACQHYAAAMGLKFSRVVVRDQKSRWGSCSSAGTLSFSWRLILAPPFVLDYLAAHEVAHLAEMNHSARFWQLVRTHCPHVDEAEAWLKRHGGDLHIWGAQAPSS